MAKASPEVIARDTAFLETLVALGYKTENRIDLTETSTAVLESTDAMTAAWDKYHEIAGKEPKEVGEGYKHLWVQCCFRSVLSHPAYKGVKELFAIANELPDATVEQIHATYAERNPSKTATQEPTPAKNSAKNPPPNAPAAQEPTTRGVMKKASASAKSKGDSDMATKKTAKKSAKKSAKKAAPKVAGKKREKGEETPTVANVLKMLGRKTGATMAQLVEGNAEAKPRYMAALIHRILGEKGYKISKERDGKTVTYFVK